MKSNHKELLELIGAHENAVSILLAHTFSEEELPAIELLLLYSYLKLPADNPSAAGSKLETIMHQVVQSPHLGIFQINKDRALLKEWLISF